MMDSTVGILKQFQSDFTFTGAPFLLLTMISPVGLVSRKLLTLSDAMTPERGLSSLNLPGEALSFIESLLKNQENSGFINFRKGEEDYSLTVEVIKPRTSLLIFGAGHVGKAVAQIGQSIGYDVTVVDDREDFLSMEKLPLRGISRVYTSFETAREKITITTSSAIVIVTRGHQHDEVCLTSVLKSEAKYIGMIGSKRRVLGVFQRLQNLGIAKYETDRVYAPIGVPINAKTPQEIAVSILAQIIQVMNN